MLTLSQTRTLSQKGSFRQNARVRRPRRPGPRLGPYGPDARPSGVNARAYDAGQPSEPTYPLFDVPGPARSARTLPPGPMVPRARARGASLHLPRRAEPFSGTARTEAAAADAATAIGPDRPCLGRSHGADPRHRRTRRRAVNLRSPRLRAPRRTNENGSSDDFVGRFSAVDVGRDGRAARRGRIRPFR